MPAFNREHLKDEHGNHLASWDQVIQMTKTKNLRPTLPDDMNVEFKEIISDCWHEEPSLRPSFTVILIRLQGIVESSSRVHQELSTAAIDDRRSAAESLCHEINHLLWDYAPAKWDQQTADILISKDATITARDPTLSKVLRSKKGASAAKALGWMMFGGMEDGAEIRPEPILATDIIVNPDKEYVLLKSRFSVIAAAKIKQWRVSDTREFNDLQAALAASEKSIESWGTGSLEKTAAGGHAAVSDGHAAVSSKKKRRLRLKRKKPKKTKKDARIENFIKAARFVRGYGAGAIHPSAKIQLYGLRMQAQRGDCSHQSDANAKDSDESFASSLQRMKLDAWRSMRGKSQEEAMEEYLSLLTSLAANWKVAHIVLGRQSSEERRKPREMMWVLKIGYRASDKEERLAAAEHARRVTSSFKFKHKASALQVTSIEIVQSSNEANARLWSEEEAAPQEAQKAVDDAKPSSSSAFDDFVAKLPKDFTLSDCIIDKSAHATIEEQRAYFGEVMRTMARAGHDEEDGWAYFGKTIQAGVPEDEQLDIYERSVEWSATSQLRTRVETEFRVEEVFEYLLRTIADPAWKDEETKHTNKAAKAFSRTSLKKRKFWCRIVEKDASSATQLFYFETEFPWCVRHKVKIWCFLYPFLLLLLPEFDKLTPRVHVG